jgi:hypothetical protein
VAAFKPLFRCRLCWRITLTVFALIFVIESVLLIPSAERYTRTERQRLADHAQILIDPVLMRAQAERAAPDLSSVIGHYGIRAAGIYSANGELLFHAGERPRSLPLDLAVNVKRGSGRRVLAVFADPYCPACKQFEQVLAQAADITVYYFMFPVIRPDLVDQSRAAWCAPDRAKAWLDLALHGKPPPPTRWTGRSHSAVRCASTRRRRYSLRTASA